VDVYLVPAGRDHHVLYCEPAGEPAGESVAPQAPSARGIWRRLYDGFNSVLAVLEREHERADHEAGSAAVVPPPAGLWPRLRSRGLRWLAEHVAEQRVLWRLQGRTDVRVFHPDDLDSARALALIHESLRADASRHGRWLGLDAVLLLLALPLTPLPGPNVLGYYFAFRVVGHFLSIRGARQGLGHVTWDVQSSHPLGELSGIDRLPVAEQTVLVRRVAGELGLTRLPRFFERTIAARE
jgi:Mitochondrial K+-H+ exchange-related